MVMTTTKNNHFRFDVKFQLFDDKVTDLVLRGFDELNQKSF